MEAKLNQVAQKVLEIGKGYSINFNYKGENMHFINGDNKICFSLHEDIVNFHTVGGSRFFYNDMTFDNFMKELPGMLLTNEECDLIYRKIANDIHNLS